MTEVESEIQFRCAPGMRVLRTADIVQIQGGPAVVVRVSASNATVLPMWGVKKEVVDRSDGTKTEFTVPRGPVAVSNSMEPSQILRHMTDEEFREFLDARTAKRAKGSSTNNNEAEKRDGVMATRKYKKNVVVKAVKSVKPDGVGGPAGVESGTAKYPKGASDADVCAFMAEQKKLDPEVKLGKLVKEFRASGRSCSQQRMAKLFSECK